MSTETWSKMITCLVLCLASTARAHNDGELELSIQASPDRLPAQANKPIDLRITVRDSRGQGRAGLDLRLDASSGRLSPVEDEGDGRYRASLRLPGSRHPQALLVAAKVPGSPPVWTVIRLLSKVELPVNTDKPRVQVTLKLGGRSYGPARTDHRGQVKIPVEVAPGEFEAVAIALDEFGNRSRRAVKIPIPASPSLVGFAEKNRLNADGRDGSDIYLVAIRPDGSPDEHRRYASAFETGRASTAKKLSPGLVKIHYTAPEGLKMKTVRVDMTDQNSPQLNKRSFSFELGAGSPQRLRLEVEPKEVVADGKSRARLSSQLEDRAGNPLAGQPVSIQCAKGFTSPVRDLGDGKYEADFTAPLHQRGSAGCVARLDQAELSATTSLQLLPPVPARLLLTAEPDRLPQDGVSHSRITILVQDQHGNPLEGVAIRAQAPLGGIDPVSEEGQGRYHLHFTAPRGQEDGRIRIEVMAGSGKQLLRQSQVIELLGVSPARPLAPTLSLGPSIAFLTNFGRLHSGGINLDLAWRLPCLKGTVYLDLETGYRFGQNIQELPAGPESTQLTTTVELIPLHLSVMYKPWPRHPITPVIGLGGGAEFVQWSVSSIAGATERNHKVLGGALATVGAELRWGPGALFLYARYLYAFLRDKAPTNPEATQASSIEGQVGGLDILAGYHLYF